jgi:hypothetical protein
MTTTYNVTNSGYGDVVLNDGTIIQSNKTIQLLTLTNEIYTMINKGYLTLTTTDETCDCSTTITTGGVAQLLCGGVAPTNGFKITNPSATYDLWASDTTTAKANAEGSTRIAANGGYWALEAKEKPLGPISIVGAVTGQPITCKRW